MSLRSFLHSYGADVEDDSEDEVFTTSSLARSGCVLDFDRSDILRSISLEALLGCFRHYDLDFNSRDRKLALVQLHYTALH